MTGSGILPSKISEIYKLVEGLQGRLNSASEEESDFLSKTIEELKARLKELSAAGEENERHLREAERKASELNATISSIADGVITYGPNGEITSMNATARELLGFSPEDFNKMTIPERMRLMKVKTAEGIEQEPGQSPLVRALNGETVRNEVRVIENPRDGRVIWTDNSAVPMYSADGRLQGVVATFTDITKRKRIEEELRKSEEKSRDLIRHSPSGIYEVDFHGPRVKSVNDAMCQYLGYTREELLSMNQFDLLDDKSKIIFQERIRKKLAGENIDNSVEYKVKAKDGREYYAVLHITFTYKNGKPEGAMVIAHDITERKRAEEALREREAELRLVADGVPLLLAHISFDLRYLFVNQSYANWFGLPKENIIGRHISEILSPEGYKGAQPAIKKVLAGEKATFNLVVQRDGQPRALDIAFIPQLDEHGRVRSYYTITQDITERKRAEDAIAEQLRNLEFLSDSAIKLLEPMSSGELFQYAAGQLQAMAGSAIVVINEYLAGANQTAVRVLVGPDDKVSKLTAILGCDPVGLIFTVAEDILQRMAPGCLAHVEGGLHDLTFNQLPLQMCERIEQDLDLGDIYAMPFVFDDDFMGTVAIITDRKEGLKNRSMLEPLVNQLTLALKQKRAEETLRQSEERFAFAMMATHDGLWDWDIRSGNVYYSPSYFTMLGYAADEFAASVESWLGLMHPDDLENALQANQDCIEGRCESFEVEFRMRTRSGDWKWIVGRGKAAARDAHGKATRLVGTHVDITERKRADYALRESKQRFRDAIDNFPNVFVIYNADRRIKYVNSKGLEIIGRSEHEVIGRRDEEIFPPEMINSYLPALMHAVETKAPQTLERTRHASMGGQTIIVNIIPLLDERGEIRQILGISHDITERKQAERALRASEERMRLFFERQVVGAAITTPEKGWLQVNDKLCQMLGYSREELANLTWAELTHPEDVAADVAQFNRMLAGVIEGYSLEKRFIRKDGNVVHTQLSVGCVRRPDKTVGYVLALLADITERKQMEEELRRSKDELKQRVQERTAELSHSKEELEVVNEELQVELTQHERLEKDLIMAKEAAEEAARVKAAFMANMSHELRTPMNAVIGMTSLLLDEKLTPEQKDYVETIRSGGESLMALINDILDFSKMEREKTEIELQDIDLRQCVEEALDLLAKNASEKDIDLAYTFEEGMPEAIIGDPARLRQVLVNLLSNAIKFTGHGEVVLTVAPEQNGKIHFSVRDTGIGIPPDKMNLLFLPFSQVDPSITRGYDGAGLGLAISKKLVELMGGEIWAQSGPGKGSTFHFTIKGEAVSAKPKPFLGTRPQLEGKSVLIIEDKRATRRILGQQILSWDMIPTIASSTQEVPKLVKGENAYDAVILDVNMSGAGDQVEEIHRRGLPLIALTSVGQHAGNKFAASISKPVKPAQIYSALSKILIQKIQEPQAVAAEEKTDYGPLRILLAEDNISNRKVTLQMLRKLGYRADAVANGEEAVEALKRQHYDLILMDVKMPVMNGIEAAREIRRLWPDNGPKIIALTAYALAGDREKCLEAGMDGYLSKPIQLNDMADILAHQAI